MTPASKTTWGGFHRTKKLIAIVTVGCDDKNYQTYKSATQATINNSSEVGLIKIVMKRGLEIISLHSF
jgi:hypothetical protein